MVQRAESPANATILVGDVRERLRDLPESSVHCVVTSPPYWGLRDYGVGGQIGLEDTPDAWVAAMVETMREVRRVLRDDGTCWVNLGDSYAGSWGNQGRSPDACKPKDLIGQPWLLAFALRADGWFLRAEVIWHKPNPMPESVTDRPTKSHEQVFLLTKRPRYFYDAEAVREAAEYGRRSHSGAWRSGAENGDGHRSGGGSVTGADPSAGRNLRSVWTIPTAPFSDAHFATFPPKLVEPCIKAGTSAHGVCSECGAPWARVVERVSAGKSYATGKSAAKRAVGLATGFSGYDDGSSCPVFETKGWQPTCDHTDAPVVPATVLDPFTGSGTTGLVALGLGRRFIGTELNPTYAEMAAKRIRRASPMFNTVEVR